MIRCPDHGRQFIRLMCRHLRERVQTGSRGEAVDLQYGEPPLWGQSFCPACADRVRSACAGLPSGNDDLTLEIIGKAMDTIDTEPVCSRCYGEWAGFYGVRISIDRVG